MIKFEEWLIENHPEILEEDWRRNMAALALGAASLFPMTAQAGQPTNTSPVSITQPAYQNQQARLDAMKRVSSVHRFKKTWGSEFDSKQDQKLFDTILKMQTEKEHDDFLNKVTKDKEEAIKNQMLGRYHPDKSTEQSEFRQINNSKNLQYMDYIKALGLASKLNLNP